MPKPGKKILSDWLDLINGNCEPNDVIDLPVLSGSMMPTIQPGKHIRIKYQPYPKINIGDIIIFKDKNALTAHRVLIKISVAGKLFVYQKGDTNRFGTWIKGETILGMVISAQYNKKSFMSLISNSERKRARDTAIKQTIHLIGSIILILPRKIKRWLQ